MKSYQIILFLLLTSSIAFLVLYKNKESFTKQTITHKCECGPTEHWFYKSCVKNYNKKFPHAKLKEDNDTEGLSENILQAIELFAQDIQFVDDNGLPLQLERNTEENLYLPLFKNPEFKLYRQILRPVDTTTTLPAQELYRQWSMQLQSIQKTE